MGDASEDAALIAPADAVLHGVAIIAAVKQSGVRTIIALPDRTTAAGLLRPIESDTELRLVRVCKEDEAIGIAAALSYCDHRALALIQYTGLLDSVNALRGVAVEYGMPICLMVGLLGKEPGVAPARSKQYGLRIVEPILDAMGITRHLIETDDDVANIAPAIEEAYARSQPVALLVGRSPVAP